MRASAPHSSPIEPSAALFYSLALIGIVTAVFLVGGLQQGSGGVFLAFAGITLIFCQPRALVPRSVWGYAFAFILSCCLSLLPLQGLTRQIWRSRFEGLQVLLGHSVTPIPRETTFWLGIVVISTLLFLFCLANPLRSKTLFRLTVAGMLACASYAAMSIYAYQTDWKYPFASDATFGFFPNRNHTASFLVTGCLLALGVLGVTKEVKRWLAGVVAALSFAICASGLLVFSASRGGVVFLVLGIFLWIAGLGKKRLSKELIISFSVIFVAGVILFLVSKGEARNRILDQLGIAAQAMSKHEKATSDEMSLSMDGRIQIYRDTWRMSCDAPLTGVGLGAYRYIYPQYRAFSLTESTSVHPESDWLMVATETGWPSLILLLGGTLVVFRRAVQQRAHPFWPLRWGILCSVLAVLGHGLVDVPLHRTVLGWWVLIWAGAGCQIFPSEKLRVPRWQRIVFCMGGLGTLTMGIWMIRAEWFGATATPPFAAAKAEKQIRALYTIREFEKAGELASEAIKASPMAHQLYQLRGVSALNFEETEKQVDADYAAQRALNPDWVQVPVQQGISWINIDPQRTVTLWNEALERSRKIDSAQHSKNSALAVTYENLLRQPGQYPEIQRRLFQAASHDPTMILIWLQVVAPPLAAEEVPALSQDADFLSGLKAKDRMLFLRIWYEKGNRAGLEKFATEHVDWDAAWWPVKMRMLVDAKAFQEVVEAEIAHHHLDLSLDPFSSARNLPPPDDTATPLEKFTFYWKSGNEVTARRILDEARVQAEKSGKKSPELWKTCASLAIHDQRWDAAWMSLQRYLRDSGLDASL